MGRRHRNRIPPHVARDSATTRTICYNHQNAKSSQELEAHEAARTGNWESLRIYLLAAGDVDARMWGATLLHTAALYGHTHMVQQLLVHGCQVNAVNDALQTPLYLACISGHTSVVRSLLMGGADVDITSIAGHTPSSILHSASRAANDVFENKGTCADMRQCSEDERDEILGFLANAHQLRALGRATAALHGSCKRGDLEVLESYIDRGGDINMRCLQDNCTPLMWLCRAGHLDMVKFAQAAGADPLQKDSRGRTSFHLAASAGYHEILEVLFESTKAKGIESSIVLEMRSGGCCLGAGTPLHGACSENKYDAVRVLLALGADIEALDRFGRTPLQVGIAANSVEAVTVLVEKGADINSVVGVLSVSFDTYDDKRIKDGHIGNTGIIVSGEADEAVHAQQSSMSLDLTFVARKASLIRGDRPIHTACRLGHTKIVGILLDGGANIEGAAQGTENSVALQGWRPLHCASRNGMTSTVSLLLKRGANPFATDSDDKKPIERCNFPDCRAVLNHAMLQVQQQIS